MIPEQKKTSQKIFTIIASIMIAGGAISQIVGVKSVAEDMIKAGVGEYYKGLGVLKLIFLALYLYPKTLKLGFLLLCCFFGGAMATLFSHQLNLLPPAIPLMILWIATYLRDKSVFLSDFRQNKKNLNIL